MSDEKPKRRIITGGMAAKSGPASMVPEKRTGPLVEDETVVGGIDKHTGKPVIAPKKTDGTVQEDVTPTDPREASEESGE